jgi:hypothetical protein
MATMGTEFWALFPEGTDIEVVESTKGDAFNVYDKRVNRANSELSKLIIDQTMTIEDGSSLSQSQTHLEVFQNLVESDADMLADLVNNQLIPRMVKLGFPLQGLRWSIQIAPSSASGASSCTRLPRSSESVCSMPTCISGDSFNASL